MVTLAAPGLFVAALVAAAVVVGLHLLARRERRAEPLPTARFVPIDLASSVIRLDQWRDRALLALRVAAILTIGLAAARPIWTRRAVGTMRVILVDRSSPTASSHAVLASVRALAQGAGVTIIAFDTVPRIVPRDALGRDLTDGLAPTVGQASISAGLIAGIREGLALRRRYQRVELHLVSPLTAGAVDAATLGVRGQWPDSLFVHRVPAVEIATSRLSVDVALAQDDPIGAAIRLALSLGDADGSASVRMRRGLPSAQDVAWGQRGRHVLVSWPERTAPDMPDTLAALATTNGTVVAYFAKSPASTAGEPIAWWSDGALAATEGPNGDGCIRMIGFAPPVAGDGAVSFGMQRLMRRLAAPCGAVIDASPLSAGPLAELVAPAQRLTADGVPLAAAERSWIAVWLLVGGLLLLVAEWRVRDRPWPPTERSARSVL